MLSSWNLQSRLDTQRQFFLQGFWRSNFLCSVVIADRQRSAIAIAGALRSWVGVGFGVGFWYVQVAQLWFGCGPHSQTEIHPVQNWSRSQPSFGQHLWTHGCAIFLQFWAGVWQSRGGAQFLSSVDRKRGKRKGATETKSEIRQKESKEMIDPFRRSSRGTLVAPSRPIVRYYRCDAPYRVILFQEGWHSPKTGAIPPLGI